MDQTLHAAVHLKLTSVDLITLARSIGIDSELDKWNNILLQIQAVLADAGQKHITQIAVQVWLNSLQQLAYDIDNLLDDLATEAMRRKLNKESYASTSSCTSKVLKIIPTCCTNYTPSSIMYGRHMSSKLEEITTRLHNLVEQKTILGLTDNVERSRITRRLRLEETSLVDESKIVGREGDKETLLKMLLANGKCDQNVSIVSIVGLGGIGKTTLAQVLYNEKQVKDHFELRSWVCVSDEFDVFNISKAVFKDVGGEDKSFENLNQLHEALKEKLAQKRFLVVLDDVWNENYREWELLQRPFLVGAPGSKIMVTTRKTNVTLVMDSLEAYPLKVLSNEAALSLFAQHALGEHNFDKHPTLKLHGESIVKKCDGLPLALMTLGRVLRTKTNNKEWEDLLNSEIWSTPDENEILPALRLSYYDLPPHLKQLFSYCSLFPKDYMFDKEDLVRLWMAEGFLYESNPSKSMEILGQGYFEELRSRSFFQQSANDESRYTMHDLINDLATSVAGEFFFRLDDEMGNKATEKFHHFSFIRPTYGTYQKFKALQRARSLRTFISVTSTTNDRFFFLSHKVLFKLLPQLQFLRVLSLTNYSITNIPQSIFSLKHIRYLNFSGTGIECLPEEVSDLYNLQSLLLSGCDKLSSLAVSFLKLINLRHLDINNTPLLNKLPLGISGLTSLQTLSKVIIQEGKYGFKISDLKGLLHLRGRLHIKGLHNVINGIQAKEANLQQKNDLNDLEMEWSDDSRNEINDYEVLEGLRPHDKLRNLKISFYRGMAFPSWIGNSSFIQLTELTLRGCNSCTCLPTLGHLKSLRKLFVESMNEVRTLGYEFFRSSNSFNDIAFPSLEVLEFKDMQGWEIWSTSGGDNYSTVGAFPRLHQISLFSCPKLVVESTVSIPSLQVLNIKGCSEAMLRSMVGVAPSIVRLTLENIEGLTQLHYEVLEHLTAVEYLCIVCCDDLEYLWESELEACKILVSLRELKVDLCGKLISLGKEDVNLGSSMKFVREVVIGCVNKMESYDCPNGIERLVISWCPSITLLAISTVQELPSKWQVFSSSLESFTINDRLNLRSLPEGWFVHLTKLVIGDCESIEFIPDEGFGFLPFVCLRYLSFRNCKKLKSFPYQHLQSLTSLENMEISHCPSMDHCFPCGLWPPNLNRLIIGDLKKPMSEWGMQNFPTSLVRLSLHGPESGVVSFAEWKDVRNTTTSSSFLLPPSLISLTIMDFKALKTISRGLQHLTCLKGLAIFSCPKLTDLPQTLLPSLSRLCVISCRKLQGRCLCRPCGYWSIIYQIPQLEVYDQETECRRNFRRMNRQMEKDKKKLALKL